MLFTVIFIIHYQHLSKYINSFFTTLITVLVVLVEFMYVGRYQLMLLNCISISVFFTVLNVLFFLIEHDIVLAYLLVCYDNVLGHVTFDHLEV